jgi:ribosomal protein S18 acetylase RimI-like enzyme
VSNSSTTLAPSDLDSVRIRHITAADLPGLEWQGEYTHFRKVYANAFTRAQRGNAVLWVAEAQDTSLLGQVFTLLKSDSVSDVADGKQSALIHSFRVRPELRGLGLGSRLLAAAEADLLQRGFFWVYLNVAHDNPGAIRLYERHGYKRIFPISGHWSYEDHLGVQQEMHEPGWRMGKALI